MHAALALHGLQEKRGNAFVQRLIERRNVVERHEREACRQRLEALVVGGVGGRRERAQRASVERALAGENRAALAFAAAIGRLARELDRRLVRFGARVTEEGSMHARARDQLARQRLCRLVMVQIARVRQRTRLLRNRGGDRRVRVPQNAYGEAADAIEIAAAPIVDQLAALARNDCQRRTRVVVQVRHVR